MVLLVDVVDVEPLPWMTGHCENVVAVHVVLERRRW